MKLLASVLVATAQGVTTNNPSQCYAQHIDIDGNLFRTNVVEELHDIYTVQACQKHCQAYRSRGCQYFIWEEHDFDCSLYTGLDGLEYDEDSQIKWMGPIDGCLGCHRDGWDYMVDRRPQNNLVGDGAVHGVSNVFKCAQVCQESTQCSYASFHAADNECYLKSAEAETADATYDTGYQTTMKGCANNNCVLANRNYPNRWFQRFDIIGRSVSGGVPGVAGPHNCHKMCQMVKDCGFWTWDKDDSYCYLVKSDYYLEPSSDKISGSRDCIPESTGHHGFSQMNHMG